MAVSCDENSSCTLLATYGTLRDDDPTSPPWTRDFIKNVQSAVTGKILGYRLYFNPAGMYGLGIFTGDFNDSIVVRVLSWSSREEFDQTIGLLDEMEGPDYERKRVEVLIDGNVELAYMYTAKPELLNDNWKRISSGDWLQRDR